MLQNDNRKVVEHLVNENWNKYTTDKISEAALERLLIAIGLSMFCKKNGATKIFNEIDANKDRNVSKEELIDYLFDNFVKEGYEKKLMELNAKTNVLEEQEQEEEEE